MGILLFVIFIMLMMAGVLVVGIILLIRFLSNNATQTSSTVTKPLPKNVLPTLESGVPEGATQTGIRRVRFDTTKAGIMTAAREQAMLEACEQAASEWLSKHPDIDLISITTTMGGMNASVTVWYKDAPNSFISEKP